MPPVSASRPRVVRARIDSQKDATRRALDGDRTTSDRIREARDERKDEDDRRGPPGLSAGKGPAVVVDAEGNGFRIERETVARFFLTS